MAESIARFLSSLTLPSASTPPSPTPPTVPISRLLQPSERLIALLDDVTESTAPSLGGRRPSLQPTQTGKCSVALIARGEAGSGEEEGAILVYRSGGGPAGPLAVEDVFALDERFKVEVEQTEGAKFAVVFTSSSSPSAAESATPTHRFSFLSDSPFPPPIAELLASVRELQATAANGKQEGRWGWIEHYRRLTGEKQSGEESDGSKRLGTAARWEGSLGAAYSARRTNSSRPPLASLDWSAASQSSMPGSFSQLSPTKLVSPSSTAGDEEAHSLYTKETHAAMERWLVQRMKEREDEFLEKGEIRAWTGTFNVNDKQPKNGAADIQSWVESTGEAELLVFGFQELDLTAEAMLRYTPHREEAWRKAIEEALTKRNGGLKYEKVVSRQLVGALIIVYARTDIREHISEVSSASLATGLMGLVANKGVVGVRLKYRHTPLTFLNSHLAAFTQNVAQRNAQVRDTASMLLFPIAPTGAERDPWTPNLKPEALRPVGAGEGYGVWECETLVWMGDLNYRIDLPRKDVERMVANKEWKLLQRFDQLHIQRQHRLAFSDFEEPPLSFPPTFKFDVGTQSYDTSEKQRVPSWTDRVLFLSMSEQSVACEQYATYPDVVLSDHKPVAALLKVPVYTVLADKRAEVQKQVIAELDSHDNDALPDVKLSPGPSVEIDKVRYNEPISATIELVNVGEVMAPWSFVYKPGSTSLTPPWLQISPLSGLILPNERVSITLTIHVMASSAGRLNFPLTSTTVDDSGISDLLIISIEKKDLFLSVAAREWIPTVFGSSVECLVRLHEPIRSLFIEKRQRIADAAAGVSSEDGTEEVGRVSVPFALHRLVNFLAEHALGVPDLFAVAGESELVKLVRECVDTGDDFPLDRLLPSSVDENSLTSDTSSDKEHLVDAVDALEQLELDIGSISLTSPPILTALEPSRNRSLSVASSSASPGGTRALSFASSAAAPVLLAEEEDTRFVGLHSVADCVLRFLESLEEPVVTFELYGRAIAAERREEAYAVVHVLPESHANTLLYIVAFLRIVLLQTQDEVERAARMDRLAVIFSAVLLRPSPTQAPDKLDPATVPRRKKAFVLYLLQDEEEGAA